MMSERIGVHRFTISRVLNHHASYAGDAVAVTAVYDRNTSLPEKRKALEAWATLLGGIVSGQERASDSLAMRIELMGWMPRVWKPLPECTHHPDRGSHDAAGLNRPRTPLANIGPGSRCRFSGSDRFLCQCIEGLCEAAEGDRHHEVAPCRVLECQAGRLCASAESLNH